jgi:hypothetical protein
MYTRFVTDADGEIVAIFYAEPRTFQPRVRQTDRRIVLSTSCPCCRRKLDRPYISLDNALQRMLALFESGRFREGEYALSKEELRILRP